MSRKKFRGHCLNGCGNEIKKGAGKYCSLRCQFDKQFKMRLAIFESGRYPARVMNGPDSFLRKVLRMNLGDACTRCGWCEIHPVTRRVPLEIEHIDGDWRNNQPGNLTLLCPNCHSLTPTYRALNRGRGRARRLGGRENPVVAKEVDSTRGSDVPSQSADVAERSKALDL